ncbi:MAG: hypothetical protein HKM88_01075 [Halobacteria archaeon]|nr:hypothetical protein [Halobacteria archaeon]
MSRVVAISTLFAGILASLSTVCRAEEPRTVLQTNPFERPAIMEKQENTAMNNSRQETPALQLRATMQAGSSSLANISGLILGIGQEIEGHHLVSVGERSVVLSKNGTLKTLSVDN